MGAKSLKIRLKNDRVEQVEALTLRTERALNSNINQLGRDLKDIKDELDIIYDDLLAIHAQLKVTRWMRLKRFLRGGDR
jgi:hypothetical protein